jgi:hypothetical protein
MHKYILLLAAAQVAQGGLAEFAGTWQCSGKAEASALGPEHPVRATLSVTPGDPWSKVRYAERRTRANPRPQATLERWGFLDGDYLRYSFDGEGGIGRAQSPGWQDGAFVWTGEYHLRGEKLLFRETFTRKGKALLDTLELNQAGVWKMTASATCTRSG